MPLTKFILIPDSSSYSVQDGMEVSSTKLDGGAARYRRDILGATSKVEATWILDPGEFRYIRAFYRSMTVSGSAPFMIDLIVDRPELTEHKAYFVPGGLQLTQQKGLTYYVSATLEVYPLDNDTSADTDYVNWFNEIGSNFGSVFPGLENQFDIVVNVEIPQDI